MIELFKNLNSTGNSYSNKFNFAGDATLIVEGDFGGGTFQLQILSPNNNWVEIDGSNITSQIAINIALGPAILRGALIGAASTPNLSASLIGPTI